MSAPHSVSSEWQNRKFLSQIFCFTRPKIGYKLVEKNVSHVHLVSKKDHGC